MIPPHHPNETSPRTCFGFSFWQKFWFQLLVSPNQVNVDVFSFNFQQKTSHLTFSPSGFHDEIYRQVSLLLVYLYSLGMDTQADSQTFDGVIAGEKKWGAEVHISAPPKKNTQKFC